MGPPEKAHRAVCRVRRTRCDGSRSRSEERAAGVETRAHSDLLFKHTAPAQPRTRRKRSMAALEDGPEVPSHHSVTGWERGEKIG